MSQSFIIDARETEKWNDELSHFDVLDPCFLAQYQAAYGYRSENVEAIMWCYKDSVSTFIYPFHLERLEKISDRIPEEFHHYCDINSSYGYAGPIANSKDEKFLKCAWAEFNKWAQEQKVIAEFTRYSPFLDNADFADPFTQIEENRILAMTRILPSSEEMMKSLKSKTRNMIKRSTREGMECRIIDSAEGVGLFKDMYEQTMQRNNVVDFFYYDDEYYQRLLSLQKDELLFIGAYQDGKVVSMSIFIICKNTALYHLGASLPGYNSAGNLILWTMYEYCIENKIKAVNLGGGRTTAADDNLFKYKMNNANDRHPYFIGKRVLDHEAYDALLRYYRDQKFIEDKNEKFLFYR